MLWSEVKRWAKDRGYETIKEKETDDKTVYYWAKLDVPDASGIATSVSKLAFAIYNHMTDNKWVDHQKEYKSKREDTNIGLTDYGN
jgi:hypothetical protein